MVPFDVLHRLRPEHMEKPPKFVIVVPKNKATDLAAVRVTIPSIIILSNHETLAVNYKGYYRIQVTT